MIRRTQIPLSQLVMALSKAIDLISPDVANHQLQVSYIALALGTEIALPSKIKNDVVIAGALHDIGALSLKNRLSTLAFEIENPHEHAETGYLLLKDFEPFSSAASLVRHHHTYWENAGNHDIAIGSHILHLADRISVLIDKKQEILGQTGRIFSTISRYSGKMFMPELVDAFEQISKREYFWLEVTSPLLETILTQRVSFPAVSLDIDELIDLARLFSKVIDFRSNFTATHSSGVAAVCEKLAELSGFSVLECKMMRIAGYLHDLGKIAVPEDILNKPGALTEQEFDVIRKHTYFTYQILSKVSGLEQITTWASFHHEQLDGSGYPFHLEGEDLPIFSRILAVADIFTALTEDRPYREGMAYGSVLEILHDKAARLKLDPNIVSILENNFDEINLIRKAAQADSANEYKDLVKTYNK
ncbi:MAG: hypothetical protein HPY66_3036 [Firmicutes bacterium]|nr:hypothetical protein [Bacillota bacterium]MDI6705174.1 HD domain-containing protein [Bacillota bacterium]